MISLQIYLNEADLNNISPSIILFDSDLYVSFHGSLYGKNVKGRHINEILDLSIKENVFFKESTDIIYDVVARLKFVDLKIVGDIYRTSDGFLYSARPDVKSLEEAVQAGLSMSSFRPGDPTYKALLLAHMQQSLLDQYRELALRLTEARHGLIEPIANMWEMSAFIAHDFKNYLNAIGMSADRIEMLGLPAAADSSLELIRQAVVQASSLADAISDVARNHKYDQASFEFHRILRANMRIFEAMLSKSIELELKLTDGPLHLRGNIPVFLGCIMTIISNAKQALGESGTVSLSTAVLELAVADADLALRPGRYAIISIVDNGPGIPSELLSQVTKPFVSTKGAGRGLGLASAAEYCRRQDGALRILSSPGSGTRVDMYLPLVQD